ncbi:MAG TPA: response regulator [Bacteroidota bacterium]|nr:response regulator [Bacteroidota bacterium]
MTALILHGSSHVGTRISDRLSEIRGLTVVDGGGESAEASKLIAELKPDVVVLDAQLGGGAGMELLRRTRSFNWPLLVIATATSPFAQYHRQCMREGADYFFQMPVELENLVTVILEWGAKNPQAPSLA